MVESPEWDARATSRRTGPTHSGCTGAIARTAIGIRYGSRSPIATVVHAIVILLSVLLLAPLIGYLPMTSLAALLMLVAWNMSEAKHFIHVVKVAPKSDVAILVTCYHPHLKPKNLPREVDVTGLVALESVLARLRQQGILTIVTAIRPLPGQVLRKAGVIEVPGKLAFCETLDEAVWLASEHVAGARPSQPASKAGSA